MSHSSQRQAPGTRAGKSCLPSPLPFPVSFLCPIQAPPSCSHLMEHIYPTKVPNTCIRGGLESRARHVWGTGPLCGPGVLMRGKPALGWLAAWSCLSPEASAPQLFLTGPWVPPQGVVRRPGTSASRHTWETKFRKGHPSLGSAGPWAGTGRSHTPAGRGFPGRGRAPAG